MTFACRRTLCETRQRIWCHYAVTTKHELALEAIVAADEMEYSVDVAWGLQYLAAVAALRPDTHGQELQERRRAARVLGYADARTAALGAPPESTEQQEYDAMISQLRDALGEEGLAKLLAEGSLWSEQEAVAQAMLI